MKRNTLLLYPGILLLLSSLILQVGCQQEQPFGNQTPKNTDRISQQGSIISGEYLVILNATAISHKGLQTFIPSSAREVNETAKIRSIKVDLEERSQLLRQEGNSILSEYGMDSKSIKKVFSGSLLGMNIELNEQDVKRLKADPRFASIEPNRIIALGNSALLKTPFTPSSGDIGNQELPYGLAVMGGSRDMSGSSRRAWIIDTGIDLDHEDLNVESSLGANFTSDPTMDDGHGHGTHVAGIIGALDNGIGVLGVAAGAKVVPIKVLDNQGYGTTADVLAGLTYVASMCQKGDVVNISLGGDPSPAIDQAVLDISNQKVHVTIAAGNSYENIDQVSPAKANGAYISTVSASDINDQFAYYSNYGPGVDYVAPGTDILSTYKDNSYGFYSGTSMAAPHVAAILLIGKKIKKKTDVAMPDGDWKMIPQLKD